RHRDRLLDSLRDRRVPQHVRVEVNPDLGSEVSHDAVGTTRHEPAVLVPMLAVAEKQGTSGLPPGLQPGPQRLDRRCRHLYQLLTGAFIPEDPDATGLELQVREVQANDLTNP